MELIIFISAVAVARAAQQQQDPNTFRLSLGSDCLDGNGRWLDYSLKTAAGGDPRASYSITEHFNDNTRSTTGLNNQFNDWLGTPLLLGSSINNQQTFTINGPGASNAPVTIKMYGKDYAVNGIFRKNNGQSLPTIIVNNTTAPNQVAPGRCPGDNLGGIAAGGGAGGGGGRANPRTLVRPIIPRRMPIFRTRLAF